MILGNILDISPKEYDSCFKKVNEVDESLPLLVVGWEVAKKYFSNSFKSYNKHIRKNTYWTHLHSLDFHEHEEDLKDFKNRCIFTHVKKFKLCEFDLIRYDYKNIDFSNVKCMYFNSNIIYYKEDKRIHWIDLKTASILGYTPIKDFDTYGVVDIKEFKLKNHNIPIAHKMCFE